MLDLAARTKLEVRPRYEHLIAIAQKQPAIKIAVVHPRDDVSLHSAVEAARLRPIVPIPLGPTARVRSLAAREGFDIDGMELLEAAHSHDSVANAVELVGAGRAEVLTKGGLHTDELMLGELVDIMDVGFTCAYLATSFARRITGETVYVDGGTNIVA